MTSMFEMANMRSATIGVLKLYFSRYGMASWSWQEEGDLCIVKVVLFCT